MKYDIPYMTTEAVSLLKSLISIPSLVFLQSAGKKPKLRISCKTISKWQVCRRDVKEIMCGALVRCLI